MEVFLQDNILQVPKSLRRSIKKLGPKNWENFGAKEDSIIFGSKGDKGKKIQGNMGDDVEREDLENLEKVG